MYRSQMNLKTVRSQLIPQMRVQRKKTLKVHPWKRTIKDYNAKIILRAHNSVGNPAYPKPKEGRKLSTGRIVFTVIGNRVTKEFIYCVKLVKGMYKYRRQTFGAPIIRGVTGIEWPIILRQLKQKYGDSAHCLQGQVAILYNNNILGGEKELKNLIEERYIYYITLNYPKESVAFFRQFLNNTGRPCAYMHIAIDDELIGCLIFMLYSDIVPYTCENFLRLCQTTNGGYSGTPVHRIVEDGWIQCGGFGLKDAPLGCENFIVPHDRRGVLGMCNADRGVDCSTQFFVLLQSALWMNHKYVAFGQLIEGHETLCKIEKVQTFYESPTKNITIVKAGILNMECDDIMINKGAAAYIDAHIEDLVSLGEMLYEWLMEKLDLEIQYTHLKSLEPQIGQENNEALESPENNKKDIRAAERFMRKKEEIRSEIAATTTHRKSSAPSRVNRPDDSVNYDFDVDSYQLGEFGGEDNAYDLVKPTTFSGKQTRAYYIPPTDVPYPGERDSNFDLKRFLQGDYCLQDDIDPNLKDLCDYEQTKEKSLAAISNIMSSYTNISSRKILKGEESDSDDDDDDDDVDDEEIESIMNYLCESVEKDSFSGKIVGTIAKHYIRKDLTQRPNDNFNDEEIRRIRLVLQDVKNQERKLVAMLDVSPWETHKEIKRRATAYAFRKGPEAYEDDTNIADEEDASKKKGRRVSIQVSSGESHKGIKRRPTAYVFRKGSEDYEDDTNIADEEDATTVEGRENLYLEKQRHSRKSRLMDERASLLPASHSVLDRLYQDVDLDIDEPTLKDYKPIKVKLERSTLSDIDNLNTYLTRDHKISSGDSSSTSLLKQPHSLKVRKGLTKEEYRSMNQLHAKKMAEEEAQKKNEEAKENVP